MIINNINNLIYENMFTTILKDTIQNAQNSIEQARDSIENTVSSNIDSLSKTLGSKSNVIGAPVEFFKKMLSDSIDSSKSGMNSIDNNAAFLKWVSGNRATSDKLDLSGFNLKDVAANAIAKTQKLQRLGTEAPEPLKAIILKVFTNFGNNDVVYKLVDLSNGNPYVYVALLAAIPIAVSALLVKGGIFAAKKIQEYKTTKQKLEELENQLNKSSTEAEQKQIVKNIATVGAQHLIYSKLTKN